MGEFYEQVKEHRFDAIINNAAVGSDYFEPYSEPGKERLTLETNVNATIKFTYKVLPLLKEHGRIINVSSIAGGLRHHEPSVIGKYSKEGLTEEDISKEVEEFLLNFEKKDLKGFSRSSYKTSKMLLNYWSRFILP